MGSIAGLTADAKSLSRWMRNECLASRYYHNSGLRLETLMSDLGNKMQRCIQLYTGRPYGVGLIVAGYGYRSSLAVCKNLLGKEYGSIFRQRFGIFGSPR